MIMARVSALGTTGAAAATDAQCSIATWVTCSSGLVASQCSRAICVASALVLIVAPAVKPDVNPAGTAPENAVSPKFAVITGAEDVCAKTGETGIPALATDEMLMPPVPPGLNPALLFQLPAGATRNQMS